MLAAHQDCSGADDGARFQDINDNDAADVSRHRRQ